MYDIGACRSAIANALLRANQTLNLTCPVWPDSPDGGHGCSAIPRTSTMSILKPRDVTPGSKEILRCGRLKLGEICIQMGRRSVAGLNDARCARIQRIETIRTQWAWAESSTPLVAHQPMQRRFVGDPLPRHWGILIASSASGCAPSRLQPRLYIMGFAAVIAWVRPGCTNGGS